MAYNRQTFVDEETVLTANHLKHIEDGILDLEESLGDVDRALDQIIATQNELIGGDSQ